MKRTPQLAFVQDPAVVAGGRVEDVLRRIRESGLGEYAARGGAGARRVSAAPSDQINGLVVVDKEAGWTSHDVVARCRRIFGQKRVGHAGTLDPDATGVLLVGLGRSTRLLRFLTALPKTYEAEVVLGTTTSTLDASGEVTGTWDMDGVSLAEVREAARRADRSHRAGAPDGLRGEGGRAAAARPRPGGHRGRAAAAVR